MTIQLKLSRDMIALVDDEDSDALLYKWCATTPNKKSKIFYARRSIYKNHKTTGGQFLQQFIVEKMIGRGLSREEHIKFANGIGTDCRRSNLLLVEKKPNVKMSELKQYILELENLLIKANIPLPKLGV